MPERRRKWKILLIHATILPTLLFSVYFFTLAPRSSWDGVDEAVVEKIAKQHGREAKAPLIDPGSGDLLLFVFLLAGTVGGFAAGYYWRDLTKKKPE
jgi:ABC-type cobalt transport system substrate-binding protein